MSILIPFLIVIHVMICILMVLVVLMQRPRSEGLGAAFGGGMADNLFGAQTTHVLQKFTVWLGAGFFAVTLLLAMLFTRATAGQTKIQSELLAEPLTSPEAPASEVVEVETPQPQSAPADAATGSPVGEAPASQ
jgi:preprotein translocase subunit SecG